MVRSLPRRRPIIRPVPLNNSLRKTFHEKNHAYALSRFCACSFVFLLGVSFVKSLSLFCAIGFTVLLTLPVSAQVYSNLDDTLTGWQNPPCSNLNPAGSFCAGGSGTPVGDPTQTIDNSTPSLDGESMKISLDGESLSSGETTNVLWPWKAGANNSITTFVGIYHVYLPEITNIQALEYDQFQFNSGTRYMMGSECDSPTLSGGYWRIWNQLTSSWVSTSVACTLLSTPNVWHSIQWNTHRVAGDTSCSGHPCMYYDALIVDSTTYGPFTSQPSASSSDPNNNGIQAQIDVGSAGGTASEYIDEMSLSLYLGTASTPAFSPGGGTYSSAQTVTLSAATYGGVICYTTNGSTPATNGSTGCTTGTLYSSPFTVSSTETVEAIAGGTNYLDGSVGSASYTINDTSAAAPTFSPVAGTYNSAQSVTLASATGGATICYTTDGSTPTEVDNVCTETSSTYTAPVGVSVSLTMNALATLSGYLDSSVSTAGYVIILAGGVNLPSPGTVTSGVSIVP